MWTAWPSHLRPHLAGLASCSLSKRHLSPTALCFCQVSCAVLRPWSFLTLITLSWLRLPCLWPGNQTHLRLEAKQEGRESVCFLGWPTGISRCLWALPTPGRADRRLCPLQPRLDPANCWAPALPAGFSGSEGDGPALNVCPESSEMHHRPAQVQWETAGGVNLGGHPSPSTGDFLGH